MNRFVGVRTDPLSLMSHFTSSDGLLAVYGQTLFCSCIICHKLKTLFNKKAVLCFVHSLTFFSPFCALLHKCNGRNSTVESILVLLCQRCGARWGTHWTLLYGDGLFLSLLPYTTCVFPYMFMFFLFFFRSTVRIRSLALQPGACEIGILEKSGEEK